MTPHLELNSTQHEARVPVILIQVIGDLDSNTYEQFQKKIQQEVEGGMRYILLDFSGMNYISSSGLRALYAISKELTAKSGQPAASAMQTGRLKSPYLKLLNPPTNVRLALEVMGLNMSLEIYNDLNKAISSF